MATKEDILEQIVEEYLTHKGYFVRHNIKFKPSNTHRDFQLKKDSNYSDIDVLAVNPQLKGAKQRDAEIRHWAQGVLQQLRSKIDFERDSVIFLAGEKYRRHLIGRIKHPEIPLLGLTIGRQLQFLKQALAHATPM